MNLSASNILVVEDDENIREALKLLLQYEGYVVTTARDGSDALNILRETTHTFRLILLDLMMPVMDGWEFLEKRSADPRFNAIPVYVLSAVLPKNSSELRLLETQSLGLLKKPLSSEVLLRSVATACSA